MCVARPVKELRHFLSLSLSPSELRFAEASKLVSEVTLLLQRLKIRSERGTIGEKRVSRVMPSIESA